MLKNIFFIATFCLPTQLICMNLDINTLSLDQKIGQLFMVSAVADEQLAHETIAHKSYRMDKEHVENMILNYHVGGIIFLGKSDEKLQLNRTCHFQSICNVPLLIGQDLEPGRIGRSRLADSCNFLSNKQLGKMNNLEYTETVGGAIGTLCNKLGVHINFAPVADVNNNAANPVINDRSFSDKPHIVTAHALAFTQGLAGRNIFACAKHFPGHGDTDVDSHHDLPVINHNKERLYAIELYPFKQLIQHGIPAIMVAHLCVPALEPQENLPATLSKEIVTDLLQNELGFTGLIITDAFDMKAITDHYTSTQAAVKALLAGNDIILCPVDVPAAVNGIKQALADGAITENDIDTHVQKILRVKQIFFGH